MCIRYSLWVQSYSAEKLNWYTSFTNQLKEKKERQQKQQQQSLSPKIWGWLWIFDRLDWSAT